MANTTKDWVVIVRNRTCTCSDTCKDSSIHADAAWACSTESEAEAKKQELMTGTATPPIVTVLPLSPPLSNSNKKRVATEQQHTQKKSKSSLHEYTCVVAQDFNENEITLMLCLKKEYVPGTEEIQWERLHDASGCDSAIPEREDDSEEEEDEEEEEHDIIDCVTDATNGMVDHQIVKCKEDLSEYEDKTVYAIVEKYSNGSDPEIKVR